jgi:hypothetical protein
VSKTDPLRVQDYVAHIVEAIDRIDRYVDDIDKLNFLSDETSAVRDDAGYHPASGGRRRSSRRAWLRK